MKKAIGIYSVVLGIGIIALWSMLLATNNVPELNTEPWAIAFHLVAEMGMGLLAVLSGILIINNKKCGGLIYLVSSGVVIYAVINSSGYYANLGQWGMVIMFAVVFVLSLLSDVYIVKDFLKEK